MNTTKIHVYLQKHNSGRLIRLMAKFNEMTQSGQTSEEIQKMVRRRYSSFMTVDSTDFNVVNELYRDFNDK